MKAAVVEECLAEIKGKAFRISGGEVEVVTEYSIDAKGNVKIKTDLNEYSCHVSYYGRFMQKFVPFKTGTETITPKDNTPPGVQSNSTEGKQAANPKANTPDKKKTMDIQKVVKTKSIQKVEAALMNVLRDVEAGKRNSVERGRALNDSSRVIIGLYKIRLEAMQLIYNFNKLGLVEDLPAIIASIDEGNLADIENAILKTVDAINQEDEGAIETSRSQNETATNLMELNKLRLRAGQMLYLLHKSKQQEKALSQKKQ